MMMMDSAAATVAGCASAGLMGLEDPAEMSSPTPSIGGSKVRPYACHICGKTWEVRSKLEIHMRTHSGAKPYNCEVCGRPFNVLSNLRRHMKTVHSSFKPFSCSFCGKTFNQNSNLKRHEATHLEAMKLSGMESYISYTPAYIPGIDLYATYGYIPATSAAAVFEMPSPSMGSGSSASPSVYSVSSSASSEEKLSEMDLDSQYSASGMFDSPVIPEVVRPSPGDPSAFSPTFGTLGVEFLGHESAFTPFSHYKEEGWMSEDSLL